MYLQITTRCNMTCEHCCFSCTAKGDDMTLETASNALALVAGDYITIGGGEPTIHPKFNDILINAIGECEGVHVITNGSIAKTALLLHKLAKAEVIGAELSQDDFHDWGMVDPEVREAFEGMSGGIRDTYGTQDHTVKARGRALESDYLDTVDECCCPGPIVKPDGGVYWCGCDGALCLGNVNDPGFDYYDMINSVDDSDECWRELPSEDKEALSSLTTV